MSQEELVETLNRLKQHLFAAPNGQGDDMDKGVALKYHRLDKNLFSIIKHSNEKKIKTQAKYLKTALSRLKRSAFKLDDKIVILPGNPSLVKMADSWKNEKSADTAYFAVRYDHQNSNIRGIDSALLAVNYRREECCLYFLSRSAASARQDNANHSDNWLAQLDAQVRVRYHGSIRKTDYECYLSFDQRAITRPNNDKRYERAHVLLSLPLAEKNGRLGSEPVGSYAGWGQSGGICVLERCTLRELAKKNHDQAISPGVRQLLAGRSVSPVKNKSLFDLKTHRTRLSLLKEVAGKYAGYGLVKSNDKEKGKLRKALIEIHASGSIDIYPEGEAPMQGRFYYDVPGSGKNPTTLCFKLNYENDIGHHNLLVFLQAAPPSFTTTYGLDRVLVGSYGGLFPNRKNLLFPRSGRFILFRDDAMNKEKAFHIPFGTEDKFADLISNEISLLPFFAGFGDPITDNPYKMNPLLMQRTLYAHPKRDIRHRDLHYNGNYLLYYPSSRRMDDKENAVPPMVFQRPLTICVEQARVVWYDEYKGTAMDYFIGSLALIGSNVSIRFNEMVRQAPHKENKHETADRSLVLYITDEPAPIAEYQGKEVQIYRQNRKGEPVMGKAVLVKIPQPINKANATNFIRNLRQHTLVPEAPAFDMISALFNG